MLIAALAFLSLVSIFDGTPLEAALNSVSFVVSFYGIFGGIQAYRALADTQTVHGKIRLSWFNSRAHIPIFSRTTLEFLVYTQVLIPIPSTLYWAGGYLYPGMNAVALLSVLLRLMNDSLGREIR